MNRNPTQKMWYTLKCSGKLSLLERNDDDNDDNDDDEDDDNHDDNNVSSIRQCPICLDEMPEQLMRFLPCLHAFHDECLSKWEEVNDTCPMCKNST
jgi:hypothetical protein